MAGKGDDELVEIQIDNTVRKVISTQTKNLENIFIGFLIGNVSDNKSMKIISCIKCTKYQDDNNKLPNWSDEITEISSLLPTGLKICGLCVVSKDIELGKPPKEMFAQINHQCEMIDDKVLLWLLSSSTNEEKVFIYDIEKMVFQETKIKFDDIREKFSEEHVIFRLKYRMEICERNNENEDVSKTVTRRISENCDKLSSSSFYIPDCNLLLGDDIKLDSKKNCKDILNDVVDDDNEGFKTKSKERKKDVLNVQTLESSNNINFANDNDHSVPLVICRERDSNYIQIMIVVDLIIMVTKTTNITRLHSTFIRGLQNQIQAIIKFIKTYKVDSSFCVPKVYHFKTDSFPYLITCVYPWKNLSDEIVPNTLFENDRAYLLQKLLLTPERPTFHPNRNYLFPDDGIRVTHLVNPHEKLSRPGGEGCHVALVEGSYSYHHYMQDNFDDNKWGCAYRSLQTISSWLRHQGYTNKPVPDHRSIQEALVAVGDKQASFIGSKKWIGSFEVSLCLEYFYEITSKIMAVNTGEELQYKGRELIRHFETQGTPIMIGGGVLAHTILGVSFNEKTGDIKFLILDPHYTGNENIKLILDKGWCGWKGPQFWSQRDHYNLCMPQRPKLV